MTEINTPKASGSGSGKSEAVVEAAKGAANQAKDNVAEGFVEAKKAVAPMLDSVSDQAQRFLQRGREAINDTSDQVREKVVQATDMAVGYAKDEPVKAMLMAAAAGAALMGLVVLMVRSSESDRLY